MPSTKTKITQPLADRAAGEFDPGHIVLDSEVAGLRIVVGKSSASWKLVGSINDGTNRGITLTLGRTNALTVRQARSEALALKLRLSKGEDPRDERKASAPTLKEALDRYLATRKGLSPRTVEFYNSMVAGPLRPVAGVPLDRLARDRVRSLHERITEKQGPAMANGAMRTAKALINDVLRDIDLPSGNVVSRAVRFNRIAARDWAIRPDELPEVWEALANTESRAFAIAWEVALCTGLRSGDIKKMRWENLDADGVMFVPNPKGGRAFHLPLTRHILQRLEELKDVTAPWGSPWCFPARSASGHMSSLRRTKEWPWAPHAMRHTYRTVAMEAGVPSDMVQVLMNHSSGGASAVSWGYVTRANLLGPMREAAEKVVERLLSYRS